MGHLVFLCDLETLGRLCEKQAVMGTTKWSGTTLLIGFSQTGESLEFQKNWCIPFLRSRRGNSAVLQQGSHCQSLSRDRMPVFASLFSVKETVLVLLNSIFNIKWSNYTMDFNDTHQCVSNFLILKVSVGIQRRKLILLGRTLNRLQDHYKFLHAPWIITSPQIWTQLWTLLEITYFTEIILHHTLSLQGWEKVHAILWHGQVHRTV